MLKLVGGVGGLVGHARVVGGGWHAGVAAGTLPQHLLLLHDLRHSCGRVCQDAAHWLGCSRLSCPLCNCSSERLCLQSIRSVDLTFHFHAF